MRTNPRLYAAALGALFLALPPAAPATFAGATNATMMTNASNAAQPFALNNLNGKVGALFYAQAYNGAVSHAACIWNATHDVADCINAAAAAAAAVGGGTVVVPAGTYGLNKTVALAPMVTVEGAGGGPYGECATTLTALAGLSGGVMVQGNSNSGGVTNLANAGLKKLCLDGATLAADGVDLWSVSYSRFKQVYISRVTTRGFFMNPAPITNAQVSGNVFQQVYIDLSDASSVNAKGWVIGAGTTTGGGQDTNRNVWLGGFVLFQNNTGFECGAADGNHFYGLEVQTANLSATGKSLDLLGNNTGALYACRENTVFGAALGNNSLGGVYAEGTDVYTHPSNDNFIYDFKVGDGELQPTIGTNATLFWTQSDGKVRGGWALNDTGLEYAGSAAQIAGAQATLGLGSSNYLQVPTTGANNAVPLYALGSDSNVGLALVPKGNGGVGTLTLGNAAATGTTLWSLAKLTGSNQLVVAAAGDTNTAIGVVVGGAGTTGSAAVATTGLVGCNFDGSVTGGHWAVISASVAGDCSDSGSTQRPPYTIGRIVGTNSGAGLYLVDLDIGHRGPNVNAQNSLNPTGTTSTTAVMMGLAGAITPKASGNVLLYLNGDLGNNTAGDGANVNLRYGTGTAPTNGAASTGTTCAGPQKLINNPSTTFRLPFSLTCVATGLTVGTTYWIDAAILATTGGTASIADVAIGGSEQ